MEVVLVAVVVAGVLLVVRARRAQAGIALKPAAALHPARGLEGSPGSGRAVTALARREAPRLLLHPAFVIGTLVVTPLLLLIGVSDGARVMSQKDVDTQLLLVPLGWSAIVAANLTTLRSRRYGSDEVFGATPVPPGSRTAAHVLACVATVPVSVACTVALVLLVRWQGGLGWPRVEVMAVGPIIVLGGAVLGVAVARWLPWAVFGWVAVAATIVLQANLGYEDPVLRWVHFTVDGGDANFSIPELQLERHGWHLAYLLGGVLLVAGVALLRSPPTPGRVGLAAAGVGLVALGVLSQVSPPTAAQAAQTAARLQEPQRYQECESHDLVAYCSWPRYAALRSDWWSPVEAVLARLPTAARPAPGGLVVAQRPDITVRRIIHPDVRPLVDPRVAFPRDEVVAVSFDWARPSWANNEIDVEQDFDLALATALWAVGLPDRPWWDEAASDDAAWATRRLHTGGSEPEILPGALSTCSAGGQARTVVALWLAGRATPASAKALQRVATGWKDSGVTVAPPDAASPSDELAAFRDLYAYDTYDASTLLRMPRFGTVVIGADLVAANALLAVPDDRVTAVLADHWEEVLAPSTPSSKLFDWLGQPSPPGSDTAPSGVRDLTTPIGGC